VDGIMGCSIRAELGLVQQGLSRDDFVKSYASWNRCSRFGSACEDCRWAVMVTLRELAAPSQSTSAATRYHGDPRCE
jgi:hypothetical protein